MKFAKAMLVCSILINQIYCFGQEKVYIPTLNEHRFISNRLAVEPFIKSSFRLNMGIGESQRVRLPSVEIGDTVIVPSAGTLVFANLHAQLNIQLNKSVAYHFGAGFSARVGSQPSSMYSNGLSTVAGIHNAWKIRLFSNDKHYLSTMLGISTYNASVINVSQFVNDIILGVPNAGLSKEVNVLRGFTGLYYAVAFGSVVGLNLNGQYFYGDSFEPGKSIHQVTGTAALDINLFPKTRIPLGASFAIGYIAHPEYTAVELNATTISSTKIAYTGSDSFVISLDTSTFVAPYQLGRITETSNVETRVFNTAINVLIYFN